MLTPKGNIFLIARTKDGKTTLSKFMASEFGFSFLSASKWVVPSFLAEHPYVSEPQEYARKISAYSLEKLMSNPNACVEVVQNDPLATSGHCIIDGVRNPRDFSILFDPRKDMVVRFEVETNTGTYSDFEKYGLQAIDSILEWYEKCGLIEPWQVMRFRVADRHNGLTLPKPVGNEIPCLQFEDVISKLRPALKGSIHATPR